MELMAATSKTFRELTEHNDIKRLHTKSHQRNEKEKKGF
jgi:hypothetical protein